LEASSEWFLVPRGTGLQLTIQTSTKKENRKYDNSPLKKINQPVAFAARFPTNLSCAHRLCTFAQSASG
jgi:hypothetical protein